MSLRFSASLLAATLAFTATASAATAGTASAAPAATPATAQTCPAWLDHEFRKLHSSQKVNLCSSFAGKPMLIVNTASHCGFTPQFEGLEAVNAKYRERGLVVVGFASDDFNQKDKDESKAAEICQQNFGVTFTMIAPLSVKGPNANPVFRELARQSTAPAWNFNKYLVRADGKVVKYFPSAVTPESAEFTQAIEALLR